MLDQSGPSLVGVLGVELGEIVLRSVGEGVLVELVDEVALERGRAGAGFGGVESLVAHDELDAPVVEDGGHVTQAADPDDMSEICTRAGLDVRVLGV